MKILAWDTSTAFPSVALLNDGELAGEINLNIGLRHSSHLLPAINELLRMTETTLEEIDVLSATIGPGSFTGIRVGLAMAKALCFSLNKPFAPVISLDALALKEESADKVIAAIDAKKGDVFIAEYSGGKRTWGPETVPIEELWKRDGGTFIGDAIIRFRTEIEKNLGSRAHISSRTLFIGAETAKIAYEIAMKGQTVGPEGIFPLYLRASDAEIKKWGK